MVTAEEKKHALDVLMASREFQSVVDSPNWRRAYDLYFVGTGIRLNTKDLCSKCNAAVLSWLRK